MDVLIIPEGNTCSLRAHLIEKKEHLHAISTLYFPNAKPFEILQIFFLSFFPRRN